jgi:hypothetical protein
MTVFHFTLSSKASHVILSTVRSFRRPFRRIPHNSFRLSSHFADILVERHVIYVECQVITPTFSSFCRLSGHCNVILTNAIRRKASHTVLGTSFNDCLIILLNQYIKHRIQCKLANIFDIVLLYHFPFSVSHHNPL